MSLTNTDDTTTTTTSSKRWQPPPVHPSHTNPDASDYDVKSSDFMKGDDHLDNDTSKIANDSATPEIPLEKSTTANHSSSKRPSSAGRRLVSAYARTMVGLNPLWLAAEAISSSRTPFSQFNRGRKDLLDVAKELSGGRDVVVVVDEKIRALGRGFGKNKDGGDDGEKGGARDVAERTAEVIRAAGENAILVVTSSLASLQSSLSTSSDQRQGADGHGVNLEPTLAALKAHLAQAKENVDARAALLLLDRSLKHPVLVAGVREFAQTRGIPHADAVLRLASLGVARLLRKFPQTEGAAAHAAHHDDEVKIEEVSAEELERTASPDERAEAERVGRAGRDVGKGTEKLNAARAQRVEVLDDQPEGDPYAEMKKKNDCVVQ